ncbi:hypothetical protein TNCT_63951 [Trichonephila clavata]|uniref:Uncharacterized protein n=1 Tax=Trichonephila clavata TaxID=2740835 RepID=A0A8X6L249_TRICU|nr:hypothetical protein TNCT_63951 [Trichonephila clavata]
MSFIRTLVSQSSEKLLDTCSASALGLNFHPGFLKHLASKVLYALLELYNCNYNSGVPVIWKKSITVPIYKMNKSSDDLNSDHPISLLSSILSKVMERRIMSYLYCILNSVTS